MLPDRDTQCGGVVFFFLPFLTNSVIALQEKELLVLWCKEVVINSLNSNPTALFLQQIHNLIAITFMSALTNTGSECLLFSLAGPILQLHDPAEENNPQR